MQELVYVSDQWGFFFWRHMRLGRSPEMDCCPNLELKFQTGLFLSTLTLDAPALSIMPSPATPTVLPSSPKGTRGRQWSRATHARSQQLRRAAPRPPPKKMTPEDVEALRGFMKDQLGGKEPREVQIDLTVAQEERKDALGQLPTGHGKTYIAAAPYALKKNIDDKRVTLMVSPLIGLQDEMVYNQTIYDIHSLMSIGSHSGRDISHRVQSPCYCGEQCARRM